MATYLQKSDRLLKRAFCPHYLTLNGTYLWDHITTDFRKNFMRAGMFMLWKKIHRYNIREQPKKAGSTDRRNDTLNNNKVYLWRGLFLSCDNFVTVQMFAFIFTTSHYPPEQTKTILDIFIRCTNCSAILSRWTVSVNKRSVLNRHARCRRIHRMQMSFFVVPGFIPCFFVSL